MLLIVGGVVAFLVVAGGGGYLLLGRGKSYGTPERAARTPSTKKTTARAPSTEKVPEKPVVKPPEPDYRIAATRLAAELAANAAAANQKYGGKLLEVSGLVDQVEHIAPAPPANKPPAKPTNKPPAKPTNKSVAKPANEPPANEPSTKPARNLLRFLGETPPISCNLDGSPTELNTWRAIPARKPITVRGVYDTDGMLKHCELRSLAAPANARFKGKEVEVRGFVRSVVVPTDTDFPALLLEGDTDSFTDVQCLFRLADREELHKWSPGFPVVVRGTCAGRVEDGETGSGRRTIRFDNCQLIDTTAPRPSVERLSAITLVRAYEEDLRPVLVPAPGEERQVPELLTVSQINKAWSADAHALMKKYQNKVLTVSGKLLNGASGGLALVLISDNTDEPLQIYCRFDRAAFEDLSTDLKKGKEYRVRGRCAGAPGGQVWHLESCQAADPGIRRSPQRLTADFLPHRPGQQLTCDVAEYLVAGKKVGPVRRLLFLQLDGGRTETVITHTGTLSGKGLFDGDDWGQWVNQKRTLAAHLPGPVYFHRVSGGYVEIGQPIVKRDGSSEIFWQPTLKLGARRRGYLEVAPGRGDPRLCCREVRRVARAAPGVRHGNYKRSRRSAPHSGEAARLCPRHRRGRAARLGPDQFEGEGSCGRKAPGGRGGSPESPRTEGQARRRAGAAGAAEGGAVMCRPLRRLR